MGNQKQRLVKPSGKGWLHKLGVGLLTLSDVAGVVLLAPLKLPVQIVSVAKYLALAGGVLKAIQLSKANE